MLTFPPEDFAIAYTDMVFCFEPRLLEDMHQTTLRKLSRSDFNVIEQQHQSASRTSLYAVRERLDSSGSVKEHPEAPNATDFEVSVSGGGGTGTTSPDLVRTRGIGEVPVEIESPGPDEGSELEATGTPAT